MTLTHGCCLLHLSLCLVGTKVTARLLMSWSLALRCKRRVFSTFKILFHISYPGKFLPSSTSSFMHILPFVYIYSMEFIHSPFVFCFMLFTKVDTQDSGPSVKNRELRTFSSQNSSSSDLCSSKARDPFSVAVLP